MLWNEELVSTVLIEAYVTLLHTKLKEATSGSCDVDTWYSLLPDLTSTNGRWNQLARQLWQKLLPLRIVYTAVSALSLVGGIRLLVLSIILSRAVIRGAVPQLEGYNLKQIFNSKKQ